MEAQGANRGGRMTAPLGFRRSTRKKLRRCGHRNVEQRADYATATRIYRCTDCGAATSVELSNYPPERLDRSRLPERIAPLPQRTLYAWREGLHIAPDVPVVGKWTGPQ